MIRIGKWLGVVTSASPYFLPPGGAVEQVNACSTTPGQLSVRGGMEAAMNVDGACLEMYYYTTGPGTDKIFILTSKGEILIVNTPNL